MACSDPLGQLHHEMAQQPALELVIEDAPLHSCASMACGAVVSVARVMATTASAASVRRHRTATGGAATEDSDGDGIVCSDHVGRVSVSVCACVRVGVACLACLCFVVRV